jgi:hypothetical protein
VYRRASDRDIPVARLIISGGAILSAYNTLSDPRTLISQMTMYSDGRVFVFLLGLLGIMAFADVVLNGLFGAKSLWPQIVKRRHVLLSALAICYVAQPYIAAMELRTSGLYTYYFGHAFMTMLVAYHDADKRSRDGAWLSNA